MIIMTRRRLRNLLRRIELADRMIDLLGDHLTDITPDELCAMGRPTMHKILAMDTAVGNYRKEVNALSMPSVR